MELQCPFLKIKMSLISALLCKVKASAASSWGEAWVSLGISIFNSLPLYCEVKLSMWNHCGSPSCVGIHQEQTFKKFLFPGQRNWFAKGSFCLNMGTLTLGIALFELRNMEVLLCSSGVKFIQIFKIIHRRAAFCSKYIQLSYFYKISRGKYQVHWGWRHFIDGKSSPVFPLHRYLKKPLISSGTCELPKNSLYFKL